MPAISKVCIGFGAIGGGRLDLQTGTEENMLFSIKNLLLQPLNNKKTYLQKQLWLKVNVHKLKSFFLVFVVVFKWERRKKVN